MCAPCVAKACAIHTVLHGWQESWGQQIQEFAQRGHEENASPGAHSETPGRSLGAGHQQRPKSENQDTQHTLHQPRGSFPALRPPSAQVVELRKARDEIKELVEKINCGPILVRLAWHDSGTYDQRIELSLSATDATAKW